MKLLSISLAVLTLMGGYAHAGTADVRPAPVVGEARQTYIVQLADEPAASYSGTLSGYTATRPAAGTRFNAGSANVRAYHAYLDTQQRSVTSLVARAPILARYKTAYNGFAARLTAAEVATLKASPLVVDVVADEARKLETISTSKFLGLTAPGGLWSQTAAGLAVKGENIIIGIVDGGIWPENPSFFDRVDGTGAPVSSGGSLAYTSLPAGWSSANCVAGEGLVPATHCNNKLIGAQYFNTGFLASGRVKHFSEFVSARDSGGGPNSHGGHGDHTASTSGGNAGAQVTLSGISMGPASGMAPRARIAAYKVCWTYDDAAATDGTGSSNSCFTSDSVSAIDKAVADGVNVINYSISGSQTSVNDPVEQAFLRAANAGVFVAASAGNSGPAQAVAHVSPWLTTVAASTHDRVLSGDVTLGNGAKYTGASINPTALPAAAMIRAEDAGLPGANATNLSLCFSSPPVLDPAKVAGKVVVCTRGTNARVDKSLAVLQAGGVGMVMKDNGAGLVADVHSVPTVHVTAADGAIIQAYAATAGSTAAISTFYNGVGAAPLMASFSSRGPNAGDANMLKPDLTAPGVDVIAAVTPDLTVTQRDAIIAGTLVPGGAWASYQGTSMSSPHVAGVAALLKQAHPTWSPMAIKSALMTTAYTTLDDGQAGLANGLLPWAQGAGHIAPNKAMDPGLVYDAGATDFIRYQCLVNKPAVSPASDCTTYGTLDATYNFNLPSVTVGNLVGTTPVTVTRKVTNVGAAAATYTSSVSMSGFTTLVTPTSLTLAPGETKSYTLKLTPTTAPTNSWVYGSITWQDGTHVVKSPVQAKVGKPIDIVAGLSATTASGSRLITAKTGFSGRMTANKGGLKDVTMGPVTSLVQGALNSASLKSRCTTGVDTANVKVYPITIAANTIVARFDLRNADVGALGDDNDMGILAPDGTWVYSGNDGSNESVQIASPAAGSYKVCVLAYGSASGSPTAAMTHKLSQWVVTTADASSSFNVLLPNAVISGSSATVGFSWSGLASGGRYLAGAQFKDGSATVQATTTLWVDLSAASPLAFTSKVTTTDKLRR